MFENIISASTGKYKPIGNIKDANCVLGSTFGRRIENGKRVIDPVNYKIAKIAIKYSFDLDLPTILEEEVANAYKSITGKYPDYKVDIPLESDYYPGSWGVLNKANEYMKGKDLESPIMVGQAYHIARVARQAIKIGLNPILPEGMPKDFDSESEQKWTRSVYNWAPREILGQQYLKLQGKL